MIIQTVKVFGITFCDSPSYITKFMKGLLHKIPPVPVYCVLWHVVTVIYFLRRFFPLNTLCLKMLTFKAVTLVALAVAP